MKNRRLIIACQIRRILYKRIRMFRIAWDLNTYVENIIDIFNKPFNAVLTDFGNHFGSFS